jgi:catechol 2,3-dioxygenase-like lactoylglutathione lyase family enzyme
MAATPGLTHAEYTNGYDIGVGVSSFAGQARGNAITWDGDPGGPTAGFTTDAAINLATTQDDFFSSLGISAEVKASYGLGSVSAKMSYAQSFKSTTLSSWIVFRVAVSQIYRQLGPHNNPAFTADALAILAGDGALQFFQTYGDLYVTGIDAGAELMGVLQIESSSEESKQELKASWDANYSGGFSASTTGEINKVLTSLKTTSSKMFRCHAFGGAPAALPKELSLEDLAARGLAFPDSVTTQNAVPLAVYLQDYRALYRPPGTHLSSPELDDAKALLAAISADLRALKSAGNTVQAILDYPERYTETLADLKGRYGPAQDAIRAAIARFTGVADACVASFTNSDTPHVPDVPPAPTFSIELPPLSPDPAFTIVSALGSPPPLVIGTDGQQPTPHLVLRAYDDGDPSQRWVRKDLGDGQFQLIAGDTKAPISGTGDPAQSPLHLVGGDAADAAGSWIALPVGGGNTCAIGDATGKVFAVWDGKAQANTPICLAAKGDTDQQRWLFLPVGMPPPAVTPAGVSGEGALYIDTSEAPGIGAFNGLFHLFYKDPTDHGQQIFHRTSSDGIHWGDEMRLYDQSGNAICTSGGPCPVAFDGQLHLFFRDPDNNGNGIMHVTSPDGAQWSHPDYIGINTIGGLPSAAVLGDTLCLVARDVKNDGHPDYSSIMMYTVSKAGS